MRCALLAVGVATGLLVSGTVLWSQGGEARTPSRFIAPPAQTLAVRAGRLFDPTSGTLSANQVILIRGDRITDVGPAVPIPKDTRVIDLGAATVLPGMIDAHVHVFPRDENASNEARTLVGVANAQADLDAGFTTVLDMDSRGGYGTVDLRNAINNGLVQGPRMQVAGPSINQRASAPISSSPLRLLEAFTENKNVNSPWLGRAAVREAKLHGVDWIKIYTTQDFVGAEYNEFRPDGTLVASPSLTLEEVQAIVDEAHRLGLKVACHTYGGEGQRSCLTAGVDAPNHLTDLDDESLKILLQKKLPLVLTIDDLLALDAGDLRITGKEQPVPHGRADFQEGARCRRADYFRKRRDVGRRPARQAGQPVRLLRQVGHDGQTGAADAVSHDRRDAELQLDRTDRQRREGQVRGPDCRAGEPARRRHRDGAGEVRHEGRDGREKRPRSASGELSR
jgi:imidazolonepropionase-like amidohydrolase